VPALNSITILGNLGGDPELRYTPDGTAVTNLSVAVTRAWPDQNQTSGWAEETIWFRVDVWREQAERIAERAHKGDTVLVQGRIKPIRQYTRSDGTAGASLEIRANQVLVLGRREMVEERGATPTDEQLVAATGGGTVFADVPKTDDIDDIPF
jgi:single-strand DNA-binding protein